MWLERREGVVETRLDRQQAQGPHEDLGCKVFGR